MKSAGCCDFLEYIEGITDITAMRSVIHSYLALLNTSNTVALSLMTHRHLFYGV